MVESTLLSFLLGTIHHEIVTAPSLPFALISVTIKPLSLSGLLIFADFEGVKTLTTALPRPINFSN